MELLIAVISLALSVFVLIALGKLFSISGSLKRLVEIEETRNRAATLPEPAGAPITALSDATLLARFQKTNNHNGPEALELRKRGVYLG